MNFVWHKKWHTSLTSLDNWAAYYWPFEWINLEKLDCVSVDSAFCRNSINLKIRGFCTRLFKIKKKNNLNKLTAGCISPSFFRMFALLFKSFFFSLCLLFFINTGFEIIPNEMNVNCYDVSTVLRQSKWVTRSVMLLITSHRLVFVIFQTSFFFHLFFRHFKQNETTTTAAATTLMKKKRMRKTLTHTPKLSQGKFNVDFCLQ